MDKRIDPIGPFHEQRVPEEELLDRNLPEQPEGLFDFDKLKRMFSRYIDRAFL